MVEVEMFLMFLIIHVLHEKKIGMVRGRGGGGKGREGEGGGGGGREEGGEGGLEVIWRIFRHLPQYSLGI
jgi:hypothetical protein